MACGFCYVKNGYTIILELVTLVIVSVFLVLELVITKNVYAILCEISSTSACILGIAALQHQSNGHLAFAAIFCAVAGIISCIVTGVIVVRKLVPMLADIEKLPSVVLDPEIDPPVTITQEFYSGASLVFAIVYVLFIFITSCILAVKHYRILKNPRQSTSSMTEQQARAVAYFPQFPTPNKPNDKKEPDCTTPLQQQQQQQQQDQQERLPQTGNSYVNPLSETCGPPGPASTSAYPNYSSVVDQYEQPARSRHRQLPAMV